MPPALMLPATTTKSQAMTPKAQIYKTAAAQIAAVIDGEPSAIARYATAACILSESFDSFFWTGFYLVDTYKPRELVVGPYQGTLGCLRIAFDRGVCGACATREQTIIVPDVHTFDGHIACDSATNSEIVVPVFDSDGKLAAVLDVDSTQFDNFDADDQAGLEAICKTLLIGAR